MREPKRPRGQVGLRSDVAVVAIDANGAADGQHVLGSTAVGSRLAVGSMTPPSHVILHFGSALAKSCTPFAVTFVSLRSRSANALSPARWASPPSLTCVPSRLRSLRFLQSLKWTRAASLTCVLYRWRDVRFLQSLKWTRPWRSTAPGQPQKRQILAVLESSQPLVRHRFRCFQADERQVLAVFEIGQARVGQSRPERLDFS